MKQEKKSTMLRGTYSNPAYEPGENPPLRSGGNAAHHPSSSLQHQHSAPAGDNFRRGQSQSGSFQSSGSYQADNDDTPRTSASEPKQHQHQHEYQRRRSSQDPSPRVPIVGSLHEVAALRKHMKILEERLRSERHSHAVKFSEIEKQLIQENAKLKVSTSALQRQIRREQQLISDHESELARLKKEKKSSHRFSLSGITRSFSDVRLEDMEMKESSLKRRNTTDSEVVRIIKERLADSEKDRSEAEALFNQRLSALLRERNVERADLRIAEENADKLTSLNDALQRDLDQLRDQIGERLEKSYQSDSMQIALLKRANSQLQDELAHFHRERGKLVGELDAISEELSLARANEQRPTTSAVATGDMKLKIDTLRVKLSSLERKRVEDVDFLGAGQPVGEVEDDESGSEVSVESVLGPRQTAKGTNASRSSYIQRAKGSVSTTNLQKLAELETELNQKKRELIEVHRKLVAVLELSQRYEYHCYNLEKELSKVYGQNYQYQETNWRKKDVVFLKDLKRVVKRTVESQTDPMRTATNSRNGVASVHATSSPLPRPKAISFVAASQTELEPLDSRDAERLAEARQLILSLQRALRTLEEKHQLLQMQFHDLSEDDGVAVDEEAITQAEVDAKIREVRERVATAAFIERAAGSNGVRPTVPTAIAENGKHISLAATNPFAAAAIDSVQLIADNYTAPSSGIWTSWSGSGSSSKSAFTIEGGEEPRPASEY